MTLDGWDLFRSCYGRCCCIALKMITEWLGTKLCRFVLKRSQYCKQSVAAIVETTPNEVEERKRSEEQKWSAIKPYGMGFTQQNVSKVVRWSCDKADYSGSCWGAECLERNESRNKLAVRWWYWMIWRCSEDILDCILLLLVVLETLSCLSEDWWVEGSWNRWFSSWNSTIWSIAGVSCRSSRFSELWKSSHCVERYLHFILMSRPSFVWHASSPIRQCMKWSALRSVEQEIQLDL